MVSAPAPCGTPRGYRRHYKQGEPACQPCKDAIAEYQRQRKAGTLVPALPAPRPACGTDAGYDRHRRDGEEACEACRAAEAARCRRYYHKGNGRTQFQKRYAAKRARELAERPARTCEFCEGLFVPKQRQARFCSAICRVWAHEARRSRVLALRLATPGEREQILARLVVLRRHYDTQRGRYGHKHAMERVRRLARYSPADPCARCGRPLGGDVSLIELDHDDADPSRYLGLSCRRCNRSAGGRASAAARRVA